jgi:guanylate kinase
VPALLEIELQGARQVRARCPDAQLVFLAPPSFDELARRAHLARHRGRRAGARRLDLARIEMAAEDEFDVLVVNDDLQAAADRLVALMEIAA